MDYNHLSIYIHWPFCLFKCPYCDFNSHEISRTDNKNIQKKWLEAYLKEFHIYENFLYKRRIKSIYFGGGTPSLMDPLIVYGILEYLRKFCNIDEKTEVTLEANPTSIEVSKFFDFKKAGVNRVSIGIQALRPENLKFLGRQHSLNEAFKALEIGNKVFGARFSFDLIYGLPSQTLSDWESDLSRILDMGFENRHISLYQLTIEKGTKFFSMHSRGQFKMPDENLQSDFYDLTKDIMKKNGFEAYEISNYAKSSEFRSVHNLGYWNYENYLGIGPGAHSRINLPEKNSVAAFFNVYKPENWMNAVFEANDLKIERNFSNIFNEKNYFFIQNFEILDGPQILEEMILMGLRTKNGLNLENLRKKTGFDFFSICDIDFIKSLKEDNFLNFNEKNLFLNQKGLKVSDFIIKKICQGLRF